MHCILTDHHLHFLPRISPHIIGGDVFAVSVSAVSVSAVDILRGPPFWHISTPTSVAAMLRGCGVSIHKGLERAPTHARARPPCWPSAGEGVAFPAIHSLIARNVPYGSQSSAVGVVTAASYVGTALAFGVSPYIISTLGWPVGGTCFLHQGVPRREAPSMCIRIRKFLQERGLGRAGVVP